MNNDDKSSHLKKKMFLNRAYIACPENYTWIFFKY